MKSSRERNELFTSASWEMEKSASGPGETLVKPKLERASSRPLEEEESASCSTAPVQDAPYVRGAVSRRVAAA
eukprot:7379920-Prymnesium_polylepis.1